MEKKKSVGVTIFGIIMLIHSLWFLGGMLCEVFYYSIPVGMRFYGEVMEFYRLTFYILWFMFPVTIPIFLIYLIASINILRFRNWARVLALHISGLIGIISGFLYFSMCSKTSSDHVVVLLFFFFLYFFPCVLFFYYFTRPKVKEQFKKEEIPNA